MTVTDWVLTRERRINKAVKDLLHRKIDVAEFRRISEQSFEEYVEECSSSGTPVGSE